jgi:hypothetical protein
VFAVTSIGSHGRRVILPGGEIAMNTMMPRFPTSFGEALKQVFVGGLHVASPDLQNLSDRCLADIGLTRCGASRKLASFDNRPVFSPAHEAVHGPFLPPGPSTVVSVIRGKAAEPENSKEQLFLAARGTNLGRLGRWFFGLHLGFLG